MAIRVNHKLIDEMEKFGAEDVIKCYHCGNCSAACPFSKEPFIFPRKSMRYLQMGLDERLKGNLEPWLCYYCGECTEQCPRNAKPGETMMSMRRWLTSVYDITGISKLFYRSLKTQLFVLILLALITGIGFLLYGFNFGGKDLNIYSGSDAFLPVSAVHFFDWGMAAILIILLILNSIRMWWFTMMGERSPNVKLRLYIKNIFLLPIHFITQKRYAQCGRKKPWVFHLVLVSSYVAMFVLIVFFLENLQYGPEIKWNVHAVGYIAGLGLIISVIYAIQGRIRKIHPYHQSSQKTDWFFIFLLMLLTVTGIVQHIFHRTGFYFAANITYILHLMLVTCWFLQFFGKWAHLAYRPLAMYFCAVQTDALNESAGRQTLSSHQLVFPNGANTI